jgi:hypothetical protein
VLTSEVYLQERLDDQIKWYDSKSSWNQMWFKRLRALEILFSVTLPFLISHITGDSGLLKLLAGAMGVAVALVAGLVTVYKFQENWVEYRAIAETLKHEKYLYLTQSTPYDGDNAFHLLVATAESAMSKENAVWSQAFREKPKDKAEDKEAG